MAHCSVSGCVVPAVLSGTGQQGLKAVVILGDVIYNIGDSPLNAGSDSAKRIVSHSAPP